MPLQLISDGKVKLYPYLVNGYKRINNGFNGINNTGSPSFSVGVPTVKTKSEN